MYVTPFWPWQTVVGAAVNAAGCTGRGLTVMATVLAALVPQPLVAVTDKVPEVATVEKLMETELPVTVIVAPVPE